MSEHITRLSLLVPGTPASVENWSEALHRGGLRIDRGALRGERLDTPVDVEWVENDDELARAFSFGTVGPDVVAAIAAAPGALVLHWPVDLRDGKSEIIGVVERLRDAGALAVRIEQSKVGWDVAQWLEMFSSDNPWAWHRLAVAFLEDEGALQSCGMHAFSLPDVRVALDGDRRAVHELAAILDVYQLAEDPVLRSGQTFAPNADTPRRVVERWPDTRYPPDHPCHNPFGLWRLGPPGGVARPLGDLELVFVPPLRVVLAAVEAKHGAPLTQAQVEATRDQATCISMESRDAQKLERSRGYADLDPELAWAQWSVARDHV